MWRPILITFDAVMLAAQWGRSYKARISKGIDGRWSWTLCQTAYSTATTGRLVSRSFVVVVNVVVAKGDVIKIF